uniref:Uncharacterized protein n=1 Tax=Parascaris equorum TaxID=6256 RepID=A0A914RXS1_PAREQ
MNQYKDLIEKSRRQFAQELKSILPNVDIHAKVEQQRIADDQFAERRLQLEMQRMQQQSDVDIERKVPL